jgi:hypothetical protein
VTDHGQQQSGAGPTSARGAMTVCLPRSIASLPFSPPLHARSTSHTQVCGFEERRPNPPSRKHIWLHWGCPPPTHTHTHTHTHHTHKHRRLNLPKRSRMNKDRTLPGRLADWITKEDCHAHTSHNKTHPRPHSHQHSYPHSAPQVHVCASSPHTPTPAWAACVVVCQCVAACMCGCPVRVPMRV